MNFLEQTKLNKFSILEMEEILMKGLLMELSKYLLFRKDLYLSMTSSSLEYTNKKLVRHISKRNRKMPRDLECLISPLFCSFWISDFLKSKNVLKLGKYFSNLEKKSSFTCFIILFSSN
jgi:hypothetical protein